MSDVQKIIGRFAAPNHDMNISIHEAQSLALFMQGIGMPYFDIVAIAGSPNGADPGAQVAIRYLLKLGVPANVPLYLFGVDADGNARFTLAVERMFVMSDLDGENVYVKLYAERNPGSTRQQAIAAMTDLPFLRKFIEAGMNQLKAAVV